MLELLLLLNQTMIFLIMDDDYNQKKHSQQYLWETAGIIVEESHRGGVDPIMVTAMAYAESKFVHTAVSKSNCCGVMQIMPRYSKYNCKQLFDRRINIREGVRKINAWKKRFGKEWLCHYNAGNVCNDKKHPYSRYVRTLYRRMKKKWTSTKTLSST